MKYYAVTYTYGERTLIDATRPRHRDYMTALKEDGTVIAAGPFDGDAQSLILFRVSDEQALDEILAADPYTEAGALADREIREWNPVINAF
nr:YciI-like protein [Streptococcus thermophilus]